MVKKKVRADWKRVMPRWYCPKEERRGASWRRTPVWCGVRRRIERKPERACEYRWGLEIRC